MMNIKRIFKKYMCFKQAIFYFYFLDLNFCNLNSAVVEKKIAAVVLVYTLEYDIIYLRGNISGANNCSHKE